MRAPLTDHWKTTSTGCCRSLLTSAWTHAVKGCCFPSALPCSSDALRLVLGAYHQSVVTPTGKVYVACMSRNSIVVWIGVGFHVPPGLSSLHAALWDNVSDLRTHSG